MWIWEDSAVFWWREVVVRIFVAGWGQAGSLRRRPDVRRRDGYIRPAEPGDSSHHQGHRGRLRGGVRHC